MEEARISPEPHRINTLQVQGTCRSVDTVKVILLQINLFI